MTPDKRRSRRLAKPIEVECRTSGGLSVSGGVRISDISAHGAFLDSVNPLPVGTRLAMRFVLHDRLVTVSAVVVNEMPQFGMGVSFVDVSPEVASLLLGFVSSES